MVRERNVGCIVHISNAVVHLSQPSTNKRNDYQYHGIRITLPGKISDLLRCELCLSSQFVRPHKETSCVFQNSVYEKVVGNPLL